MEIKKCSFKIIILLFFFFNSLSVSLYAGDDAVLYEEAIKHLEQGHNDFAYLKFHLIVETEFNSKYRDEALFRVAEYYLKGRNFHQALIVVAEHKKAYPNSDFKEKVQKIADEINIVKFKRVGNKFYKNGRWQEALMQYNKALSLKIEDNYLIEKIQDCQEILLQEIREKGGQLFKKNKWNEALNVYMRALNLGLSDRLIKERIDVCKDKIVFISEQKSKGFVEYKGQWMNSAVKEAVRRKERKGVKLVKFEKNDFMKKYCFEESGEKIISGNKAFLYKNSNNNLLEVLLDNQNKMSKLTLVTGVVHSESAIKVRFPDLISDFIQIASNKKILKNKFDKLFNTALKNQKSTAEYISEYYVDIGLVAFKDASLLTITVYKKPAVCLTGSRANSSGNKLTVNLDKGSLSLLKIGDYVNIGDIVKIIGSRPEDSEDSLWGTYYYFRNKGIIMQISFASKISELHIFCKRTKEYDGYYNGFKGNILNIGKNVNINTVRSKFGIPAQETKDLIYDSPVFIYRRHYGSIGFNFDKNGILNLIIMTNAFP